LAGKGEGEREKGKGNTLNASLKDLAKIFIVAIQDLFYATLQVPLSPLREP
jgi:hypothetical protein